MEEPSPEKRQKAVKIGLLTIIIIPLALIGGYYLWSFYIMRQFANSLTETIKKSNDKKVMARRQVDVDLLYTGLLSKTQDCVYTGQNIINDTSYTVALQTHAMDSFSVSYRIEYLINWKKEKYLTGIARLDTSSLGSQSYYFKDETGKPRLSFRFLEENADCTVEILISKEMPQFKSKAVAIAVCHGKEQLYTPVLHFK